MQNHFLLQTPTLHWQQGVKVWLASGGCNYTAMCAEKHLSPFTAIRKWPCILTKYQTFYYILVDASPFFLGELLTASNRLLLFQKVFSLLQGVSVISHMVFTAQVICFKNVSGNDCQWNNCHSDERLAFSRFHRPHWLTPEIWSRIHKTFCLATKSSHK